MPSVLLNFPSIHIACRDHPNQLAPDRIRDKEQPSARRAADCPVALFARRVPDVAAHHQRLLKENVLGLLWRNLVPLPILDDVRFIPIESETLAKRIAPRHTLYISHMYNFRDRIFGTVCCAAYNPTSIPGDRSLSLGLLQIVEDNKERIERAWNEFFS